MCSLEIEAATGTSPPPVATELDGGGGLVVYPEERLKGPVILLADCRFKLLDFWATAEAFSGFAREALVLILYLESQKNVL